LAAWSVPPGFSSSHARGKNGESVDEQAYDICLKDSVAEVVQQQTQAGVDIVNDGEFGKSTSWSLYALQRLSGFEMRPIQPGADPFATGADRKRFKEFYAELEGGRYHTLVEGDHARRSLRCPGEIHRSRRTQDRHR